MSDPVQPQSVAIVMSRLKRLVIPDEPWINALRGVSRRIAADHARLIVADGTAGSAFVRHVATRLQIPICDAVVPADVDVVNSVPACDQALVESADLIYVLNLRPNGNLHRLLQQRLDQLRTGVILVNLPGLQSEELRSELCLKGATLWQPTADQCLSLKRDTRTCWIPMCEGAESSSRIYSIAPFPTDENWDFLVHTTRACPGPWPDESFSQYVDHLLDSNDAANHSAVSALRRIVTQKRLIASSRMIRGGSPVVSFTACPLANLPALYRFRPHRVRWDFEPFGLCLRRDWLINQGVRPVQYGDDSTWQNLSEADRPFFQLAIGESGIDWSVEQEWRLIGDLDLTSVSEDDVMLFVPDYESAKSLAEVTTWPITLCANPQG